MREFSRLQKFELFHRKFVTWAKMSITILTVATVTLVPATISSAEVGTERFDKRVAVMLKKQEANVRRQLGCLARNVFYEANGEPMEGQMAVAQVTVNRARSGLFPRDLCAVVAQTTYADDKTKVCQFSWMCDSKFDKTRVIDQNNESYVAARRVYLENQRVASLGNDTLYFHRFDVKINPNWPHHIVEQIGNHVFYKRDKN
jgi:spore germination cell wall hydrolase CwlJ-like protein